MTGGGAGLVMPATVVDLGVGFTIGDVGGGGLTSTEDYY